MQLRRRSNGASVLLGPVLGKGGEGSVFPVRGASNLVAKIYAKPPVPAKVEKLLAMAGLHSPTLLRAAAWPIDLLVDEKQVVRGFLMPRVTARADAHELYSPKSRRSAFPEADFRFVVRAGANIARAFAVVHAQGHVIGDVNHGNALVGRDGTIVLIDCDSFQIRGQGKVFSCDVGVPLFTPPELQGRVFRGLRRTANHDAFGLAVLLFHLLFLGRHPYAGRHASGDMPIEQAIAESRFAYGAASASLGVSAPPGTLSLDSFGPRVAALFERAFAASGERPPATEWIDVLESLEQELDECPESRFHFHPRDRECCWCEIEGRTQLRAFGPKPLAADLLSAEAIAELWKAVATISAPSGPRPPKYEPAASRVRGLGEQLPVIALSWALVLIGVMALLVQPGQHVGQAMALVAIAAALRLKFGWRLFRVVGAKARRELARAEANWRGVYEEWENACSTEGFDRVRQQLQTTWGSLVALKEIRTQRLERVARQRAIKQANRYLSQFRIADASFSVTTPAHIAALAIRNITTAADIARLARFPYGVVSKAAEYELTGWCQNLAGGFKLDPADPHDAAEIAQIEKSIREQQQYLVTTLREGPELLTREREQIKAARDKMEPVMDEAWKSLHAARRKVGLPETGNG